MRKHVKHFALGKEIITTVAILSQKSSDNGRWHPVAFLSKSLLEVEWNYKIHDKEMLAII